MFVSCFVCAEDVAVSATSSLLIQESLIRCASRIVRELETSMMTQRRPDSGCFATEKEE